MKNQTSALDLYYIVKELQDLIGAKVNKVYQNEKEFLIDFHKTGVGKIQLRFLLPDFAFLTKYKVNAPTTPPKFCIFLRKRLNNNVVKSVEQHSFERILEIKLAGKEVNHILIVELFSKGNIILCDENYKIISPFQPQSWQARTIRGGTKYEYPPEQVNPLNLDLEKFSEILKNSEFSSIVKCLAVNMSLSGVYAEEACLLAGIDKDSKPSEADAKKLYDVVNSLFKQKINANSVGNELFPFEMKLKEKENTFSSFNEAIDEVVSKKLIDSSANELEGKKSTKIESVKKILQQQEETIKRMEVEIDENKKKGELIFENYQEIKEILDGINIDRKSMNWDDVKEKYKGKVKQINEKEGIIVVDL